MKPVSAAAIFFFIFPTNIPPWESIPLIRETRDVTRHFRTSFLYRFTSAFASVTTCKENQSDDLRWDQDCHSPFRDCAILQCQFLLSAALDSVPDDAYSLWLQLPVL